MYIVACTCVLRIHVYVYLPYSHAHVYTHIFLSYTHSPTLICVYIKVDPVDIPKYFSSTADIIRLADHTACDAVLVQKLVLKLQIVPLTKQLTNLSGVYTVMYGVECICVCVYKCCSMHMCIMCDVYVCVCYT